MVESEDFGEEVEVLGAKTLRPALRIRAEDLVASELASAVLSEPLAKIRHVCEAFMLLDEKEKNQAEITENDEREVEKIYMLAVSLSNIHTHNAPELDGQTGPTHCSIPWPFSKDEAKNYLDWAASPDKNAEEIYTISEETLILNGRTVLTRFLRYAMPKVTALMKKIIRLVSPDSYMRALQIMRGGKREKQKAKS